MNNTQKIVLITGASRGIGRAIAETFAKRNYLVLGTATTEAGAENITTYLHTLNTCSKGYVLDVCNENSVSSVYEQICKDFSAPNILINNAAITQDNLFLRMKSEEWNSVIDTNLNSVYRITKLCLRDMLKKRWGRVISITSLVAFSGNAGQANYCAAKAGVVGLTKSLAQEMAGRNITCNTVAPGFVLTDMTKALTESQQEAILNQIPMRRMGSPEDIAHAVNFLASDEAAYITGQTLHVNGGLWM